VIQSAPVLFQQHTHPLLLSATALLLPSLPPPPQVIVKKGEKDLPGLTDEEKPRMRGPKRASKVGRTLDYV